MLLDHLQDEAVVLIEAASDRVVTAGAIRERAALLGTLPRGLVFLLADASLEAMTWLHATIEAGFPIALLDAVGDPASVAELLERYRPDIVIDPGRQRLGLLQDGPTARDGRALVPGVWYASEFGPAPHPDLAVLLTTSGSTGSPKFVRLSRANIRANAEQIVRSLGITSDDRGLASLPLFYSFGMSILTSHALAASPVVLPGGSVIEPSFWSDIERCGVTIMPGVPTTYSMLKRLGFERRRLPALRALIQAGGRLSVDLIDDFHSVMTSRGGRFFVMYGQTEASPRISCLPSERLPEKLGSVGPALSGGVLTIRGADGTDLPAGETGEIHYRGPNVMMGYAESRADLALGATHGDVLATGDLGYLDDEGFLFITGRSKRICKLAGSRVSLDEIEIMALKRLDTHAQAAAVDADDKVALVLTHVDPERAKELRRELANQLHVPPNLVRVHVLDAMPLLPTGKPDYASITQSLKEAARR